MWILFWKTNKEYILQLPATLSHKRLGKNIVADLLDSLMVKIFEHLEFCANNKRLSEVFSEAIFVQIFSFVFILQDFFIFILFYILL